MHCACVTSMYDPLDHVVEVYQVLRQLKMTADFSVNEHAKLGSHVETQFISITANLSVASFFAANYQIGVFTVLYII